MKPDLPDSYVPIVIQALRNQAAAMQALGKDHRPYLEAIEYFRVPEPKAAESEDGKSRAKRKSA